MSYFEHRLNSICLPLGISRVVPKGSGIFVDQEYLFYDVFMNTENTHLYCIGPTFRTLNQRPKIKLKVNGQIVPLKMKDKDTWKFTLFWGKVILPSNRLVSLVINGQDFPVNEGFLLVDCRKSKSLSVPVRRSKRNLLRGRIPDRLRRS